MLQQAETAVVGRHRRERIRRHRAGLTVVSPRSRGTVLTAALGAALVTGGSTAAAAHHPSAHPAAAEYPSAHPAATAEYPSARSAAPGDAQPATTDATPLGQPTAQDQDMPRATTPDVDASPLGTDPTASPLGTDPTASPTDPTEPPVFSVPTAAPGADAPDAGGYTPAIRAGVAVKKKSPPKPAWVNPNPTAAVTSCFGPRWGRVHEGVDLAAPDGAPIVAAGAGVVVRAGAAEGYGNAVLIDHGNGFLTHYGHMSSIAVTVGQHVRAGQRIGAEGSTGHSTGPHLHFEVHQGFYKNAIEPTQWMHEHGVDISGCVRFNK